MFIVDWLVKFPFRVLNVGKLVLESGIFILQGVKEHFNLKLDQTELLLIAMHTEFHVLLSEHI